MEYLNILHINYQVAMIIGIWAVEATVIFSVPGTLNDLMCLGQSQNIISKFITAL